jgi:hypothetical protein
MHTSKSAVAVLMVMTALGFSGCNRDRPHDRDHFDEHRDEIRHDRPPCDRDHDPHCDDRPR